MGRQKNDPAKQAEKIKALSGNDGEMENPSTAPQTEGDVQQSSDEPTTDAAQIDAGDKKLYTEEEVAEMVRQAAADAAAEAIAAAMKNMQPVVPQQVVIASDTEKVHFLWQAEVMDDNVVQFGEGGMYGSIVGKTGNFFVPKSDLSRVLTDLNRRFLRQRWLIIVSGLTEEERDALGVNYKEGELLDRNAFAKMVELGDEMLNIYPALCEGHKMMVAQRYADAFAENSEYVTRERVVKLNAMSKREGHERGDFIGIIERMNERDTQ